MKRIAVITLRVEVTVPDNYSEQTVASIRSCFAHYDISGGVRGVVGDSVHHDPAVDIRVSRNDRDLDTCAAELTEDITPPPVTWPVTDHYADHYQLGAGAGTPRSVRGY